MGLTFKEAMLLASYYDNEAAQLRYVHGDGSKEYKLALQRSDEANEKVLDYYKEGDQMPETDEVPELDLGTGEPPAEMKEAFGMEAAPTEGPSDESEGEVVSLDEAIAESDKLTGEG